MSAHDPGETFFGVSVGTDPFQLLGLPRKAASETEVLQALGARMSAIAGHPRSQTPEANEIRLALHAAAAQLLDPKLQELLLQRSGQSSQPQEPPPQTVEPARPEATNHVPMESAEPYVHPLTHDVLLVVAANGGWNAAAMRRLAMLAHARGIASQEIPSVITKVLANPISQPAPQPVADPIPVAEDEGAVRIGSVAATRLAGSARRSSLGVRAAPWVIGAATLVSLVLVWVRMTSAPTNTPDAAEDNTVPSAQDIRSTTRTQDPARTELAPAEMTARDGARQITQLANRREGFGETEIEQFRRAYLVVARDWTEIGRDQIGAVHDSILELLYSNASKQSESLAILAAIGEPMRSFPGDPEGFRAWVLSVATMSRLSMERNLPTSLDSAIIGRLTGALGEVVQGTDYSFEGAVLQTLGTSSQRLASQNASDRLWRVWLEQLGAVAAPGEAAYDDAVLNAIERVMLLGADPSQSRPVFQSIETLASALRLEPGSAVAERLVLWLSDDRVTISDIGAVMRPLVSRSRTEGIDESLVLSSAAGETDRMALRSRIEEVLLGRDSGTSEAVESWMDIADQQLVRENGRRPVDMVARAVVMSRLSAAARATLWGDRKQADSTLANLTDDIEKLVGGIESDPVAFLGGSNADEWARKYIDARQNIPIRQALLGELARNKRALGPVAAEVIVRDAFLGTPATVRAQAREVVRLYADSPAILNGVLEYLPRIPKIDASSELIEAVTYARLPSVKSPAWSSRARQACVDELLRRLTGIGEGQVIDALAALLQGSYENRLGGSASLRFGPDAVGLAETAAELSAMWRRLAENEAEEFSVVAALDDLDHRSVGRLLLAEGALDRFAAHQVTAVEAMSLLVIAESPAAREQVEDIRSELSESRRNAKNVLEQIVACEVAAVKLWKLRLERSVL